MKNYGQGDVLLKSGNVDLKEAVKEHVVNGRWIVAEGEVTGHAHVIKEDEAVIYNKDGKRYVLTENGFTITHKEHDPITVEPGCYEIGIVQEYDYFLDEARAVAD